MPFIVQERRQPALEGTLTDIQPGDLCFVHYKYMVNEWKKSPRWTTAHSLYKDYVRSRTTRIDDDQAACELAWQVFFIKYAMPYEDKKETENGTI